MPWGRDDADPASSQRRPSGWLREIRATPSAPPPPKGPAYGPMAGGEIGPEERNAFGLGSCVAMYRTSNLLWEYYVVKIAKRSARDRRTIVRTLASSQKSSRKAAELSVATGRVIAKRAALGVAAMVDPARADHKEF